MENTDDTSTDWREARRLRAWELNQRGWKVSDIAKILGVSQGSVNQWIRRASEEGVEGLRCSAPRGALPRLSPEQMAALEDMLSKGAAAFGFKSQVWTSRRVAQLIHQHFDISYHHNYIPSLLKRIKKKRDENVKLTKKIPRLD